MKEVKVKKTLTNLAINSVLHERIKRICDDCGYRLQTFTEDAMLSYIDNQSKQIKLDSEKRKRIGG